MHPACPTRTKSSTKQLPPTENLLKTGFAQKDLPSKTCWLVDSEATCHIVSEKWVKHYTVSYEYPGPSPSLNGAGDNDLPVKGVVDLEFKVGKITMKRVVVVGIL